MKKFRYKNDLACQFTLDVDKSPVYIGDNYLICADEKDETEEGANRLVKIFDTTLSDSAYRQHKETTYLLEGDAKKEIGKLIWHHSEIAYIDKYEIEYKGDIRSFGIIRYASKKSENFCEIRKAYQKSSSEQRLKLLEGLIEAVLKLYKSGTDIIVGINPCQIFAKDAEIAFVDLCLKSSKKTDGILTLTQEERIFDEFVIKMHYYLETGCIENNLDDILEAAVHDGEDRKNIRAMMCFIRNEIPNKARERKAKISAGRQNDVVIGDYLNAVRAYNAKESSITPKIIEKIEFFPSTAKTYFSYKDFVEEAEEYQLAGVDDLLLSPTDYLMTEDKTVMVDRTNKETGESLYDENADRVLLDYECRDGVILPVGGEEIQYGFEEKEPIIYDFQRRAAKMFLSPEFNGRGILADQVGMGKTIEAGLIISEFAAREEPHKRWNTLLIIVPGGEKDEESTGVGRKTKTSAGSLVKQWKNEMSQKFGLPLHHLKSKGLNCYLLDRIAPLFSADGKRNLTKSGEKCYPACIIDANTFVKQKALMEKNGDQIKVDMIVVDEAHNFTTTGLRRYAIDNINKILKATDEKAAIDAAAKLSDDTLFEKNARLSLLKKIMSKYCILLTATPHRGDLIMFYPYIKLLRTENEVFTNMYDFFVRFCEKCITVNDYYKKCGTHKAGRDKISQQMSSIVVRNTRDNTRNEIDWKPKYSTAYYFYDSANTLSKNIANSMFSKGAPDEFSTHVYNSAVHNQDGTYNNRGGVVRLIEYKSCGKDTQMSALDEEKIKILAEILQINDKQQVIVFFNDEADSKFKSEVEKRIKNIFRTKPISDVFTAEDKQRQLDREFTLKSVEFEMRMRGGNGVLLADAKSSEGRNLQFAHVLVNYHILNCPMKMEQRIGRIDRIGQKNIMDIHTFASLNDMDGQLLELYDRHLELFSNWNGDITYVAGSVFGNSDDNEIDHEFEKHMLGLWKSSAPLESLESFLSWRAIWDRIKTNIDDILGRERHDLLTYDEGDAADTSFSGLHKGKVVTVENKKDTQDMRSRICDFIRDFVFC